MGLRENKKNPEVGNPTEQSNQNNQFILAAPFGAVVLLHAVGCLFPVSATWGFSCWSLTDPAVSAFVFGLGILLLWPRITRFVARSLESGGQQLWLVGQAHPRTAAVLTIVIAAALIYLLRPKALAYGDGYTVLSDASESEGVSFQLQTYFQVLSVYFYYYLLKFADSLTTVSPEKVYAIINVVGGMLGLWALLRISRQITGSTSSRFFVLTGAFSSASILLFFGYVENYTWSLALSLWTLSFAIGYTRGENGPFGLAILAGLATFFHAAALPIAVVALLSLFMRSTPGGNMVLGFRLRTINAALVLGALVLAIASHFGRTHILVPLYAIDGNPYWVLSHSHMIDLFNQAVLVGGLGLALLAVSFIHQRRRVFAVGVEDGILGTAALLTFLAAFWINPDIGAPRDWDLLAFFGLPVTLWGSFRFAKLFPGRVVASAWSVAAAVVVVVHLGANLYEKNHPQLALDRLDGLLYADPHYQTDYKSADRCLAWASILQRAADRPDLAVKYLKRRAQAVADEYQVYFSLGDIYYRQGRLDSAAKYMASGLRFKPDDMRFLMNLCAVEQERGNYERAFQLVSRAVEIEPDNVSALTQKGITLGSMGKVEPALNAFRKAYELSPRGYDQIVNLGITYALAQRPDSAYHYVCLALPIAPAQKKPGLLCCAISAALELKKRDEAAYHLEHLKRIAPGSPDIGVFTAALAEMNE